MIVLLICGVGVFGQTDDATAPAAGESGHAGIDCARCHAIVASLDGPVATPSPRQQCRNCHNSANPGRDYVQAAFHRDPDRSCGDCHLFHESGMVAANGYVFFPAQSAGPASCAACHDGSDRLLSLSEGHRRAANLYHSNNPALVGLNASQTCLLCHAEGRSVAVAGLAADEIPRFSGRGMHPIGLVKRPEAFRNGVRVRRVFDARLPLFDNRIECHTCHQLTNPTENRLINLGSPEALCLGCHEFE